MHIVSYRDVDNACTLLQIWSVAGAILDVTDTPKHIRMPPLGIGTSLGISTSTAGDWYKYKEGQKYTIKKQQGELVFQLARQMNIADVFQEKNKKR